MLSEWRERSGSQECYFRTDVGVLSNLNPRTPGLVFVEHIFLLLNCIILGSTSENSSKFLIGPGYAARLLTEVNYWQYLTPTVITF